MILGYVGKPGGGKSYRALEREIHDELLYGTAVVVTNLSILPGELAAYFQAEYPNVDYVDLHKRLRILTEEETRKFWLHPAPGVDIEDTSDVQQKAGVFPDFTQNTNVLFVIDEAHKFFDARGYQTEGVALTHVNSQHRKLDWRIVFITQFPELISKRIKGFVQEWHNCRNFGVEKIFNFFAMPKRFYVKITQREPSDRQDDPGNWEIYRLNPKLAACYDTSAGVGIKGRKMPERKPARGIPLGWLAVPFVALMAALYYGPDMMAKAALGTDRGKTLKAQYEGRLGGNQADETAKAKTEGPYDVTKVTRPGGSTDAQFPYAAPSPVPAGPPPGAPYPTGYVTHGGVVHVLMSDGTRLVGGVAGVNDGVEAVHRNGVVIRGTKYYFKAPPVRPAAQVSKNEIRATDAPPGLQVGDVRDGRVYQDDGTWALPSDAESTRLGPTSQKVNTGLDFTKSELQRVRR